VIRESPGELSDDLIVLRPFTLDDVPDVTAACQDPEIVRWTARIPSPYTQDDARSWISGHEDLRDQRAAFIFAIVNRADRRLSGSISVEHIGVPSEGGLFGYWVAPWARNRGFARRALRLLSEWALAVGGFDALHLTTMIGNTASERVAEACGFVVVDEVIDFAHPGDDDNTYHVKRWTLPNASE
jgi:RimJ/RimL family protein N-acetyltransferase